MKPFIAFRNEHEAGSIIVCGCGESLNQLSDPGRFTTIGVNDVGRKFDPDYLVVVDPRDAFKGDRFRYVEQSRARVLFTQRSDLALTHPGVVQFQLGEKDGTDFSNPNLLHFSVITPYVALCLAIHMGASNIGLIGVDFTDNHFFGPTGQHGWAPYVATIDGQIKCLARAALARGVRIFNLSDTSRLTCLPRLDQEGFARIGKAGHAEAPLRLVSYATTPIVGVPAILARCINATTPHVARCVWAGGRYANGIACRGDLSWGEHPARVLEEIEAADVVIVHNGKVDDRHRAAIAGKPVITMAHNYMANVDDRLVRFGNPGVVVGQYQATLEEFDDWAVVPNPLPLWEHACRPAEKPGVVTIAYTPAGHYDVFPQGHPLYWHAKGYASTMRILDRLAARMPVRVEVLRGGFVSSDEAMAMKRRAHIVIDECVTGSYHRCSLEGLAAGCVVVNGVGLLAGVEEVLSACAGGEAANPFIGADLESLEAILEVLVGLGPALLASLGAANRVWIERHWDFQAQWQRFWVPALTAAQAAAVSATRCQAAALVKRTSELCHSRAVSSSTMA
jgi:hypothetical protein